MKKKIADDEQTSKTVQGLATHMERLVRAARSEPSEAMADRLRAAILVMKGLAPDDGAPHVNARDLFVHYVRFYAECRAIDARLGIKRNGPSVRAGENIARRLAYHFPDLAPKMTEERARLFTVAVDATTPTRTSWKQIAEAWRGIDADISADTLRVNDSKRRHKRQA